VKLTGGEDISHRPWDNGWLRTINKHANLVKEKMAVGWKVSFNSELWNEGRSLTYRDQQIMHVIVFVCQHTQKRTIWGSHSGDYEDGCLVGCNAV
jgi:hypothetical protein